MIPRKTHVGCPHVWCVRVEVGRSTKRDGNPVVFADVPANERTTRVKSYVHASHHYPDWSVTTTYLNGPKPSD